MADEVILFDSPEAASIKTVTGWVSRLGLFYGDNEEAARYSGCTHMKCTTCDSYVVRGHLWCGSCKEKRDREAYNNRPAKEWDGKAMLYSETNDQYFLNMEEVKAFVDDIDTEMGEEAEAIAEMRLVICEPNFGRPLTENYFASEMDDDSDLPGELIEAMSVFNEVLKKGDPLSWSPGKYRLKIQKAKENAGT